MSETYGPVTLDLYISRLPTVSHGKYWWVRGTPDVCVRFLRYAQSPQVFRAVRLDTNCNVLTVHNAASSTKMPSQAAMYELLYVMIHDWPIDQRHRDWLLVEVPDGLELHIRGTNIHGRFPPDDADCPILHPNSTKIEAHAAAAVLLERLMDCAVAESA